MSGVRRYRAHGRWWWEVDVWVRTRTGSERVRERRIPTKEQAEARLAAALHDAYEGRAFKIEEDPSDTVSDAWEAYRVISERDNDSWRSDASRAAHLLRHLGKRLAVELTQADVDAYRTLRGAELTKRKAAPSPATLDREVELLKRALGYAVKCGRLRTNPLAGVALLRVPNVRSATVDAEGFEERLAKLGKRSAWMRPVLLVAFETGMRIGEVLHLRRDRIEWRTGRLELEEAETKTEQARAVYLSARTIEALRAIPPHVRSGWLFYHPKSGRVRTLPRRGFKAAFGDLHVHDLRRSFATGARKEGVPESVVMRMGGWRTPAVFRRYNIVDEEDLREAARRLEEAREKSPSRSQDPAKAPRSGEGGPSES